MGYIGQAPANKAVKTADIEDSAITSAKILDGTIVNADVNASAAIAESKLTVSSFDDTKLRQDISALALHSAVADNKTAHNLPNSFIEQFQDDTGIATETTGDRNASEYWSTTTSGLLSSNLNFVAGDGSLQVLESVLAMDNRATFTQEVWVKVTATTIATSVESGVWGSAGQDALGSSIELNSGSNQYIYVRFAKDDAVINGPWHVNTSTSHATPGVGWHHYAEVVSGGTYTLYEDGTSIHSTATDTGNGGNILYGTNLALGVGAYGNTRFCKAMMNDWRISSTARYTGNFTPSTNAFVSDGNTLLLVQSNTTDGSTTFTDISSNAETVTKSGGSVEHSTDDASNLTISTVNATGTLISNASVASAAQTKVSGVALYKDSVGTATIGTDLKIYFSCDNGSNWTEASSYGTVSPVFSTGVKMIRLGDTTCTSGTQVKYKAVWANQASGSKDTQLHGIGMNY